MASPVELGPEVEALATALGVIRNGSLDSGFFSDPLGKLRGIISDPGQRAGLLNALDDVLPPGDAPITTADGDTITRHPIATTAIGSLAISIDRSGPFNQPNAVVGLYGEAVHTASGTRLVADFPLIRGSAANLDVVAGTPDSPLAVGLDVPVGWDRATDVIGLDAVNLSALVLAPPHLSDSRVMVQLTGLDLGLGGPTDLTLDPAHLGAELSHALTMLLLAGLHAGGNAADAGVERLIAHLPAVLGLDGVLPLLPLGDLVRDPKAFAGWLAQLATTTAGDAPGLVRWLDAVGQLLGAGATTLTELPTAAAPLVATVVDGGTTGATVDLRCWLETTAATTVPELHIGVDVHVSGSIALVAGRAELLVVPLGGSDPVRPLSSAEVVVESVAPLLPGPGGLLRIGIARGGLRWDGTQIIPVLELDGVHVELPGVVQHPMDFPRLDLTHARTLAAEAQGSVGTFLTGQLGTDGLAASVFAVLGLSFPPTVDELAAFANDPLRAIGAFHRHALTVGTYRDVAASIVALFGATLDPTGAGTASEPWVAPLTGLALPAGSSLTLALRIWDVPSGSDHELHVGLAAVSPAGTRPSFGFGLTVDLVMFSLPAGAAVRAGLIGETRAEVDLLPPQVTGPLGRPGAAQADRLSVALRWRPGASAAIDLVVHGLVVDVAGTEVTIAELALPQGLTAEIADTSWTAVRQLLAGAARSWGGSVAATVADLLGLSASAPELPTNWPRLELPAGGLRTLLADPLALLRTRLADLVRQSADPDDDLPIAAALDQVRDVLTHALPPLPELPSLPSAPPVLGSGSYVDPWRIPLTDAATPLVAQPIDLIGWVEPGPPKSWSAYAGALLGAVEPDLAAGLAGLTGVLDEVTTALAGLESDVAGGWLTAAAAAIDGTDGLIRADMTDALPTGIVDSAVVTAAHHLAPQAADAVTAARAHLTAHGADGLPVLLVGPGFAADDVWSGFLDGVDPGRVVRFRLDVPGIDPALVDLGTMTAGSHYLLDLADDGTPTLAQLQTRLDRLVQRVMDVTDAAKVAVVAHSVAALPVVAYAAAHPSSVQACVTIAAPYAPGISSLFDGAEEAAGLRVARALLPAGLAGAPALQAALDQLGLVLDGYAGANPRPFPTAAFSRTLPGTVDLTAIPTLAIAAQLDVPLAGAVATALSALLDAAADAAPTHVAWGVRAAIDLGTDDGPQVDLHARLDLGRVALSSGAAEPAHPARRIVVDALVHQPDGWLVGGAGTGVPLDVRLRAARLRFEHTAASSSLQTLLYDGAVQGSGAAVLDLADARSARLLSSLFDALAANADTGTAVRGLLDLLSGLELITFDAAQHTAAVRADAVAAIRVDPAGWLGPRTANVLQTEPALFGLAPVATQAGAPRRWRRTLGDLPFELAIRTDPWSISVTTTGDGLDLGGGASLRLAGLIDVAGQPTIEATVTAAGVTVGYAGGVVTLAASPLLAPVPIFPAAPDLTDRLLAAVSTTGLAAAATAVLEHAIGGVLPVSSIVGLLSEPSRWLSDARRFGDLAGGLDPAAVTTLLTSLAQALNVSMEAEGLPLADGFHLAATGTSGDLRLTLTGSALVLATDGPTLDVALGIDVAAAPSGWTVSPGGTMGVRVPLPGGVWPSLTIITGLDTAGFSLAVKPGAEAAIPLLPHFGGLWDLLGGGVKALLPGVLDGLVNRLSPITPGSVLERAVAVADALGLRPNAPDFDSAAMAVLVEQIQAGTSVPTPSSLVGVVDALLPTGAPVTVSAIGTVVEVAVTALPVAGTVTLTVDVVGGGAPPTIAVELTGVVLGPVSVDVSLRDDAGVLGLTAAMTVDVPTDLGFDFTPTLRLSAVPLTIDLLPLGLTSPLTIQLAPVPGIAPSAAAIGDLVVNWVAPIVAKAALDEAEDLLELPLWTPSVGTALTPLVLLRAAQLVDQNEIRAIFPLPDASVILRGLLGGLGQLRIPVTPELSVGLYAEGPTWLGLGLNGHIDLHPGDFTVSLLVGSQPEADWTDPPAGLGLLLLDDAAGLQARPGLRLGAVGVKVAKNAGPLVDTGVLQIGSVAALVQAALDLEGGTVVVSSLHGGVEIAQIGLPIGQSGSASNPVASSLLKSDDGAGDSRPASPPTDLTVISNDTGALTVRINAKAAEQPFYVDIHKTFGPLHIDRIGLEHKLLGADGDGVGALVDGGVSIAGLTVEVQGLELTIPLKHAAELSHWGVDLSGLAVAFSAGPVAIAGGLLKQNLDTGVEYDGMLTITVGSFGLTALGAYAKANGASGDTYTSLFVFVVIKAPLGGPPFLFVTGLAGGAGYNRQLIVPTDPALIPTFPLVRALDQGVGSHPMDTLHLMSAAMPARRGSYWVAAGVSFTTFELINSVALAYVSLDRGFEVGLMGLMRMALPTAEDALVSIELALLARYSTADQLLAVRAQLTNNSWLISKDCQLTGGFAFYNWFGDDPQTLLTIGGMGPNWRIAPGDTHPYPVVPPVGFHWSVGGGIVVKGESYFALTPRQLAFGGRLEASYDAGPIRVWFTVYLDVDISWKPLHYHIDAGISIGAQFHFTIDLFFGSITISVSISLGGSIVIDGPPLHGTVTVELEIASVTVDFGRDIDPPSQTWGQFAAGFLAIAGAPDTNPDHVGGTTSVATVGYGQYANSRQGPQNAGPMPDGGRGPTPAEQNLKGAPWPVRAEFGLDVAAKMPLASAGFVGHQLPAAGDPTPPDLQRLPFSIKPMGSSGGSYSAHLEIGLAANTAGGWVPIDTSGITVAPTYGHFPVAIWLAAGVQPPGGHPDMWLTVSGASLAFPVTISEASGALGGVAQIPISTLVEESGTVLPLPLTTAPHVLAPHLDVARPRASVSATRARTARLVATLTPRSGRISATRSLGTPAHAAFEALWRSTEADPDSADGEGFGVVASGETHVWMPPANAEFLGRGAGRVRVTTISPTGFVLDDHEGAVADVRFDLHPESDRVVVTGLGAEAAAPQGAGAGGAVLGGWQPGTVLTQVAPDTLLGPACAVLLPWPVTAARPRAVERQLCARDVLDLVPGTQTLLPSAISVLIVLLDAWQDGAADDLVVSLGLGGGVAAGALGPPTQVIDGSRRCLIYPVVEAPAAERLAVAVASAQAWRVAGVAGATGDVTDWVDRLRGDPHADLVANPVGPADSGSYRIAERTEVPA